MPYDLSEAKPLELIIKGGNPDHVAVYGCGNCKRTCQSEQHAKECCSPYLCDGCGQKVSQRHHFYCNSCQAAKQAQKDAESDQKALAAAQWVKLEDLDDYMLCCSCHTDEFFSNEGDLFDYHWGHLGDTTVPEYAIVAEPISLEVNSDDVLQNALENQCFSEGTEFSSEQVNELQRILDDWLKVNSPKNYFPDNKYVDLKEDAEAYVKENQNVE